MIRSQTLYSIELRDQFFVFSGAKILPFFELASIFRHFFSKKFSTPIPNKRYLSDYQLVMGKIIFLVQEPGGECPDDENHESDESCGQQWLVLHDVERELGYVGLGGFVVGDGEPVLIDGLDGLSLFII